MEAFGSYNKSKDFEEHTVVVGVLRLDDADVRVGDFELVSHPNPIGPDQVSDAGYSEVRSVVSGGIRVSGHIKSDISLSTNVSHSVSKFALFS